MMMQLHGLVLAGVHRWQNSMLEQIVPRVLLPVGDRSIAAHVLEWIRRSGIRDATMCANSDTATLRRALGDGKSIGIKLRYFEDVMPRGPAGCMRDAAWDLDAEEFVVVDATILPYALDLQALLEAHRRSGAALTVVAATAGRQSSENCSTPVGVFVVSRDALAAVPESGYQDIKQGLIPKLHGMGRRVVAHEVPAACPRVTDLDSYLATVAWLLEYEARQPATGDDYLRIRNLRVHGTAEVHSSCRLVGHVRVGPGTVIEKGAAIVGPTTIGRGCIIREGAVVSRSVVWDGATVGENAVLDRCILSYGAGVTPGRHQTGAISVSPMDPPSKRSKLDPSDTDLIASVDQR